MDAPAVAPIRKVASAAIGGAVATILIWLLSLGGIEVMGDVAAAIVLVVTFIIGYLVPASTAERPRSVPKPVAGVVASDSAATTDEQQQQPTPGPSVPGGPGREVTGHVGSTGSTGSFESERPEDKRK
jgi:hypothetical protein